MFHSVDPLTWKESPFQIIGKEWMLISAMKEGKVNAMTASWGGLGVMWGKNVAYIVIRPQRYTKEFVDSAETFSLSVFEEKYRDMLNYMGSVSGRKEDKIQKMGLTVCQEGDTPYFEEARLNILCKKLYAQRFEPACFMEDAKDIPRQFYGANDYHTLYVGEVLKILEK